MYRRFRVVLDFHGQKVESYTRAHSLKDALQNLMPLFKDEPTGITAEMVKSESGLMASVAPPEPIKSPSVRPVKLKTVVVEEDDRGG